LSVDEAIDELYGSSLDEFVTTRARVAKAVRDAGDPDGAQAIAKLRKPTVAAWVLNQLSRRHRRDVDLLLDAGHRLREAQAGALAGDESSGFESARRAELEARRRLQGHARLISQERGRTSPAVLDQVDESLRAAAISEDGRELLARGRFVEPIRAEGFDVVSRIAEAAEPRRASSRQAQAQHGRREAEAALEEARSKLREAERAAREAEQQAGRLDAESRRARKAADAARADADLAAGLVEAAERRLRQRRGR
jgi:hypothetical protein